ncbi:kinase-like domain-containing protein, partial [Mycena pura]
MLNGNIIRFMRNNPTCTEQRRLSFILDVAGGLKYLHEKNVIHGDLKGANILVTPSGRACIADFGLSSLVLALTERFTESTARQAGTARYLPPELLRGERKRKDFSSDVYSFAGVSYEILTGKVPFFEFREEAAVLFKVLDGNRPSKPTSSLDTLCFDRLWNLFESCWKQEPEARPACFEIVKQLRDLSIQTTVTSADWDPSDTVKFRRSLQIEPTLVSVVELDRMIF